MNESKPADRLAALAFGAEWAPEIDDALVEAVTSDDRLAGEAGRLFLAAAATRTTPPVPASVDRAVVLAVDSASSVDPDSRGRAIRGPLAAAAIIGIVFGLAVGLHVGAGQATDSGDPAAASGRPAHVASPTPSDSPGRPRMRAAWDAQTYRSGFIRGRDWTIVSSR